MHNLKTDGLENLNKICILNEKEFVSLAKYPMKYIGNNLEILNKRIRFTIKTFNNLLFNLGQVSVCIFEIKAVFNFTFVHY